MVKSGSIPGNGQATIKDTNNQNLNPPTLPIRDIYSININDYNSSSQLNAGSNQITNNQPLPPITVHKANRPPKNGFQFNQNFLIIPLIAFTVIAVAAIACGVVFGILYQPEKGPENPIISNDRNVTKDNEKNPVTTHSPNTGTISRSVCGTQPIKPNLNLSQLRIMNGHNAIAHSWPWVVSIGYRGPRSTVSHACGGSLINKRTVVTATHCVESSSVYQLVGNPNNIHPDFKDVKSMLRMQIGINRRSQDINEATTFRALQILQHPGFDSSSFKNDISIIVLDRDVVESDEVGFICVSPKTNTTPGTRVYAIGWGFTKDNWFKASDDLKQVSFLIKNEKTCGLNYVKNFQFCAGDQTLAKDTCSGDSGGPIMTYENSRFTLTGIVSNGDASCSGRGIYTNVQLYYDWIIKNTYVS